ncbi:MAG TPA: enoyl-CoA hydratase-related protein [Stellaceae bacterium]|nr:enoyl-CoA hydratase-related protein [Stellaceae bacterium]
MADEVLIAREDGIATVTLNRPERLNALTWAMWEGVGAAMATLETEDDIRCIVLRGAGEKAFAPGADIAEFAERRSNATQARNYGRLMHETMGRIGECRHPTVALIQGICVGGGLELAMLCDIRICGEGSRFGVPINRLGVTMGYPEIAALIELVGRQTALEILLEGRVFGAVEAKEKGLVSRVVPDRAVVEEAYATARRIAAGAPLVNRWHKQFARRLKDPRPLDAREFDEPYQTFDTEDFKTGYRSFLDKETPQFRGR